MHSGRVPYRHGPELVFESGSLHTRPHKTMARTRLARAPQNQAQLQMLRRRAHMPDSPNWSYCFRLYGSSRMRKAWFSSLNCDYMHKTTRNVYVWG